MEPQLQRPADYRVLARAYRPTRLSALIGQEALVRTLKNAFASGRVAHAFLLSGIRGVGKTTTARIIARGLNCTGPDGQGGPTPEPCGVCASCQRDRRGPRARRDRDGRGLADRQGGRPGAARRAPVPAQLLALQGLHPGRGAHALVQGLERAAEDGRGAAAARQVHLRHHRAAQGPDHRPVALPEVRAAPGRARGTGGAPGRHLRQGRRHRGAGGPGDGGARRRGLRARRAVPARPGDRHRRRSGRRRAGPVDAGPGRPAPAARPVRHGDARRRQGGAGALRRSSTPWAPTRSPWRRTCSRSATGCRG